MLTNVCVCLAKSCRNQKKKIGHKKQSFANDAKAKKFVILQVSAILLQPKKLTSQIDV